MPRNTTTFDVFIASPSDVKDARSIAVEVINDWNTMHSRAAGINLHPVRWETHTHPDSGDRPQALINRQVVENADILIAIFWTRLGTKTGKAASGTVEEIEEFRATGKPILLYFSKQPIVLDSVDPAEYKRLKKYQKGIKGDTLYGEFEDNEGLRTDLTRHLSLVMHRLAPNSLASQQPIPDKPDPSKQRIGLARGLRNEVLRIQAEWNAEQASDRPDGNSGKHLLLRLAETLARIVGSDLIVNDDMRAHLHTLLIQTKNVERTTFFADGGESSFGFWRDGTDVIRETDIALHTIAQGESATTVEVLPDEVPR